MGHPSSDVVSAFTSHDEGRWFEPGRRRPSHQAKEVGTWPLLELWVRIDWPGRDAGHIAFQCSDRSRKKRELTFSLGCLSRRKQGYLCPSWRLSVVLRTDPQAGLHNSFSLHIELFDSDFVAWEQRWQQAETLKLLRTFHEHAEDISLHPSGFGPSTIFKKFASYITLFSTHSLSSVNIE